jgi:transcriptional regulator with XRE-family HTH domain
MFRIRLKTIRENADLSQAALAAKLGVKQSTVGGWESGNREPNFDTLLKIADLFGVSVDYLLGRVESPLYRHELQTGSGKTLTALSTKKEAPTDGELVDLESAVSRAVPLPGGLQTPDILAYIRQIVREELGKSGGNGN